MMGNVREAFIEERMFQLNLEGGAQSLWRLRQHVCGTVRRPVWIRSEFGRVQQWPQVMEDLQSQTIKRNVIGLARSTWKLLESQD